MSGHSRHGHRPAGKPSPTYASWAAMIQRCCNPKASHYERYGGRGIRVCIRWGMSFEDFLADMGERPAGMELERIDNDGDYTPGNCRWATRSEQLENTTRSRKLTVGGETLALSAWSRRYGVSRYTILSRLDRGWSVERAVTTPAARCGRGAR